MEDKKNAYTKTEISASQDNKWVLVRIKEITRVSENKKTIEETNGVVDRIEVEKLLAEMNRE